jgi:hypothetical protein
MYWFISYICTIRKSLIWGYLNQIYSSWHCFNNLYYEKDKH